MIQVGLFMLEEIEYLKRIALTRCEYCNHCIAFHHVGPDEEVFCDIPNCECPDRFYIKDDPGIIEGTKGD